MIATRAPLPVLPPHAHSRVIAPSGPNVYNSRKASEVNWFDQAGTADTTLSSSHLRKRFQHLQTRAPLPLAQSRNRFKDACEFQHILIARRVLALHRMFQIERGFGVKQFVQTAY